MIRTNQLLAIIAGCLIIAGCQKEISFSGSGTTTTTSTADSTLLSLYVEIDSTLPAPFDTLSKIVYSYDNLNRCTGNIEYDYSSGFADPFNRTYYFYDGNDTLPDRETYVDYDSSPKDSTLYFYAYNSSGDLVKDSGSRLTNSPQTFTRYFSYSNNSLVTTNVNHFSASTTYDTTHVHYVKTNGNITSQTDTLFMGSSQDYNSSLISYDNHPNPFYKVTIHYPYLSFEHLQYWEAQQKNNILDQVQYASNSTPNSLHWGYSYKYNAKGYPSEATVNIYTPVPNVYKVFLYYK